MRSLSIGLCILTLATAAACRKKSGGGEADTDDPAIAFVGDDLVKDLQKVKAAMAANTGETAMLECAGASVLEDAVTRDKYTAVRTSPKYKDTVAELLTLCDHDFPVAVIKTGVEAAESARKAKPDAKPLSECFNGSLANALDKLKKHSNVDAPVTALLDRMRAACPDQKY